MRHLFEHFDPIVKKPKTDETEQKKEEEKQKDDAQ